MNPPDEDLILFFYGEHEDAEAIGRALATDPELARRYERLQREMSALDRLPAPEPRPGLEGRMWARVAPDLTRPSRRISLPTGWLGWAAISTAVIVVGFIGFLAGRTVRTTPTESAVAQTLKALPPAARDRVLQAALADHLDSSQRFLLEVKNGDASLEEERAWAESLLSANRLYRRAAEHAGQRRVAAVLAEIEPLLTQLAESPEAFDLGEAQARIESADLLFKVRVTRNNLKELS
jgi:hypothetical protein